MSNGTGNEELAAQRRAGRPFAASGDLYPAGQLAAKAGGTVQSWHRVPVNSGQSKELDDVVTE